MVIMTKNIKIKYLNIHFVAEGKRGITLDMKYDLRNIDKTISKIINSWGEVLEIDYSYSEHTEMFTKDYACLLFKFAWPSKGIKEFKKMEEQIKNELKSFIIRNKKSCGPKFDLFRYGFLKEI